eukprot:TRINITY_DN26023_c0_g2_i1.p1 TRINITY_DN26023_c0_g2~~TRINITY_DN26023_c0_g2_i1.p1  ORF type:complete len:258 (-),score=43.09 TRINITY_DN26023_c0_g2_i1:319-1017(-)
MSLVGDTRTPLKTTARAWMPSNDSAWNSSSQYMIAWVPISQLAKHSKLFEGASSSPIYNASYFVKDISSEHQGDMEKDTVLAKTKANSKAKSGANAPSNRSLNKRVPTTYEGVHCKIFKHSSFGCAVVTLPSSDVQAMLLKSIARVRVSDGLKVIEVEGCEVTVRSHVDKFSSKESLTGLFVGWGRQVELSTPLRLESLAKVIDDYVESALWCLQIQDNAPVPEDMPTPRFQ